MAEQMGYGKGRRAVCRMMGALGTLSWKGLLRPKLYIKIQAKPDASSRTLEGLLCRRGQALSLRHLHQLVRFISANMPTSCNSSDLERNCIQAGYSAQPNSLPPRDWEVGGWGRDGQDSWRTKEQLQGKLLDLTEQARAGAESDLFYLWAIETGQSIQARARWEPEV